MTFPESALTKFGAESIRRYYLWQLNGPHKSLCIGAFDETKMVGFCFAGVFREAETGFLRKNRIFLIWRIMTHPWLLNNEIVRDRINYGLQALKRLARKKKAQAAQPKPAVERFGILSIAVHPQYQALGIGKLLMADVETSARQGGFNLMRLSVHPNNRQAVLFYEGLGWKKKLTNGAWEGYMEKSLD